MCAVGYLRAAVHEGVREESTMPLHATTTYPCAPLIPAKEEKGSHRSQCKKMGGMGLPERKRGGDRI
jgi:hypothetical protein